MTDGIGQLGALVAPPPVGRPRMPVGLVGATPSVFLMRSPVRNQAARNSCTGHAFGTAVNIMAGGSLLSSCLALYYDFRLEGGFAPTQDMGAYMDDAARALTKYGAGSEALWPYGANGERYAQAPPRVYREQAADHKVTAHYTALSVAAMKTALAVGLPVVLGFEVPSNFGQVGTTGVWTDGGGPGVGGHAVCCVGYDDDSRGGSFLIQNSWGSAWGTHHPNAPNEGRGYFWLPYSAFPGSRWFDAIVLQTLDLEVGS